MVMGGLMQLVAYGGQEVFWRHNDQGQGQAQGWVGYNQGFKRKSKANHKVRFFYKNVKNKNNKQPKPETNKPKQAYTNSEPGYIYTSSVRIYPAQNTITNNVAPKRKTISQKQRAINSFGWRKIAKFEVFCKEKLSYDRKCNQIVNFSSYKNTWSNKKKLIDLSQTIKPIITKKLKTRPSLKRNVYLTALLNNLSVTNPIESLYRLTSKHFKLIKQTDISVQWTKRVLKNSECPISLCEITTQYIKCSTCETTYDYSNTIDWFKINKKCAYCTNKIDITPQNLYYNPIYELLKN
jgi:hypothetical protein